MFERESCFEFDEEPGSRIARRRFVLTPHHEIVIEESHACSRSPRLRKGVGSAARWRANRAVSEADNA
jgi:hypothetical protein